MSRQGAPAGMAHGIGRGIGILVAGARRAGVPGPAPHHGTPAGSPGAASPGAPSKRSPLRFFALLFLISIPEYLLRLVPPWSLLMVYNPLIAATILTCRESGRDGVRALLRRPFDYRRITRKRWYVPILLLPPAAMALQYAWLRLTGAPVAGPQVSILVLPVYFLVFLVSGIGEETGWSGYALDPLQERWSALAAALVIGTVWALWHLVPYVLANPPGWVLGQLATTVLLRVLMVWIYNNTGQSVFGMVLFHAMINMATIPDYGFAYDPVFASAVLAVAGAVVVLLWGPATLARYRYARRQSGAAGP